MTRDRHLPKGIVERTYVLPRTLADQVREAAYKSGRPESVLVREAIEQYLATKCETRAHDDPPT